MSVVIFTVVLSSLLCGLYLLLARRWRILDTPNERSSHQSPTPHGGGLPLMLALAASLPLAVWCYGPWGPGFGEVDPAQWREVLEVNSIAPLMLVQSFVEQACRQRERRKAASLLNSTVTPLPGEAQSGVS